MDRFYSLASRLFGYLAFALALLAPLAVPQNAWADSGSDCAMGCGDYCAAQCGSDMMCSMSCNSACNSGCSCSQQYPGDPSAQAACCQTACNGDPSCVTSCSSALAAGACSGTSICQIISDPCKWNGTKGYQPVIPGTGGTGCPGTHTNCSYIRPNYDCSGCKCIKQPDGLGSYVCGCAVP